MRDRPPPMSHMVLVRYWQEGHAASDGAPAWRYVVEEVGEERRRYAFTSREALLAFLHEWLHGATQ